MEHRGEKTLKKMKGKCVLLVDGSHLAHVTFHVHRDLMYKGTKTGMCYGMLQLLYGMHRMLEPKATVVVWDIGGKPTWRHKYCNKLIEKGVGVSEYKKRKPFTKEQAEDMADYIKQSELAKKMIRLLGLYQLQKRGVEGDDLIGTLVSQYQYEFPVVICSGDNDFRQLLSNNVVIYNPRKSEFYTKRDLNKEYNIVPGQFVDLCALMGDVSDTIRGIDMVGPKTAIKLMRKFGSVKNMHDNLHMLDAKQAPKFEQYKDVVMAGRKLKAIKTDIKIHDTFFPTEKRGMFVAGTKEFLTKLGIDLDRLKLSDLSWCFGFSMEK